MSTLIQAKQTQAKQTQAKHNQPEGREGNGAQGGETQTLTFTQMLHSTLAAAIGVQNSANRKRDFTHGNWLHFVFMGVGFTAFFVLMMVSIVRLVLSG